MDGRAPEASAAQARRDRLGEGKLELPERALVAPDRALLGSPHDIAREVQLAAAEGVPEGILVAARALVVPDRIGEVPDESAALKRRVDLEPQQLAEGRGEAIRTHEGDGHGDGRAEREGEAEGRA